MNSPTVEQAARTIEAGPGARFVRHPDTPTGKQGVEADDESTWSDHSSCAGAFQRTSARSSLDIPCREPNGASDRCATRLRVIDASSDRLESASFDDARHAPGIEAREGYLGTRYSFNDDKRSYSRSSPGENARRLECVTDVRTGFGRSGAVPRRSTLAERGFHLSFEYGRSPR